MVSPSGGHSDSLEDSGGEKRLRGVTAHLGDGVVKRLLAGDGVTED